MRGTAPSPTLPPRRMVALLAFLRSESASGFVLIAAAVVALILSNSPLAAEYFRLLNLPLAISLGTHAVVMPVDRWVNQGLMALFFLTVSLEIRREMTEGHLASLPRLAAPSLAALGGMIVPVLLYTVIDWRSPATLQGWAVPMATDIAFVLAALTLLGRRAPVGLKVFVTALAILDDLGAIVVIAIFYSTGLHALALGLGALTWLVLYGLNRAGVKALSPYILGGAVIWGCLLRGGIHPTLAGVALAFVIPTTDGDDCPADRLESGLGGWVTWGVLPLFGLANAGLRLKGITADDFTSPVVLGIMLGLAVGKQIGVFGATLLALRLKLARLPAGFTKLRLYGCSLLCGIGFTVSLFIGDLGFHGTPVLAEVKLAIFLGSLASAAAGLLVLALAPEPAPSTASARGLVRT